MLDLLFKVCYIKGITYHKREYLSSIFMNVLQTVFVVLLCGGGCIIFLMNTGTVQGYEQIFFLKLENVHKCMG